jgi:hypothetical protein
MSTASADYEHLLNEAINQARTNAPRAVGELLRLSSTAAEAVAKVTGGAAALELVPINQEEGATPTYQLQLRKVGSEAPPSDLGVYCVTAAGYPVHRWYSRRAWESHPDEPDGQYSGVSELEGNFRWMVSNPESRLVVLVTFFQQNAPSSAGSAAGSA